MEFLGHQKAFSFLLSTGMIITTFVSDRYASIAKWMQEECPKQCKEMKKNKIEHCYDCWHVNRLYIIIMLLWVYTSAKNNIIKLEFNAYRRRLIGQLSVHTLICSSKEILFVLDQSKALLNAGKEKECEKINRWRKTCIRHFYWSVISSRQHPGDVKYAKFEALLSHVVNDIPICE